MMSISGLSMEQLDIGTLSQSLACMNDTCFMEENQVYQTLPSESMKYVR